MNAKAFAVKNVGRRVFYKGTNSFASIVGYNDMNRLIIEPDNPDTSWERIGADYGNVWLVQRATRGWHCSLEDVRLEEEIIKVKPYPHICKRCMFPARRCGNKILCSNTKCKSWQVINKTYKSTELINYEPLEPYKELIVPDKSAHLEVWHKGGCLACAHPNRNGNTWMHNGCWDAAVEMGWTTLYMQAASKYADIHGPPVLLGK